MAMILSVKVIIRDENGQVLLLRRSANVHGNQGKWEFPGGKVALAAPEVQAGATAPATEEAPVPAPEAAPTPGAEPAPLAQTEPAPAAFEIVLRQEVAKEVGAGLKYHLEGPFGTGESLLGQQHVIYLMMKALAETTTVRLSADHDEKKWVSPSRFNMAELAPQFRRIALRYAQEVAANEEPKAGAGGEAAVDGVVTVGKLESDLMDFVREEDRLKDFALALEEYLSTEVKVLVPMAEVSARAKDAVSFAGKLIKKDKYKDPLKEVTDLVGARVVVHLASEVDTVCKWIEKTFQVDPAHSGDKLVELGVEKFGYRSVHYVVEMRKDKLAQVNRDFAGLKAEIQVRTIAQHAWADIGHDRLYKQDYEMPEYWKRQSNRISALLEAADEEFARLVQGLAAYQDHIRHYPTQAASERLTNLWDVVRLKLPKHPQPALRVARIALDRQDWKRIIAIADAYKGPPSAELLAAEGYAICKVSETPGGKPSPEGVTKLKQAAKLARDKVGPLLQLGELFAGYNRGTALKHYEEAFTRDPSHPEALVGYIRSKVLIERSTRFLPLLRPDIERAIRRSEELVAAEADVPRSLFRIAGFLLLLGPEHARESLAMLARAVHWTNPNTPDSLLPVLKDLSDLVELEPQRLDIECARRFVAAAFLTKCPEAPWPAWAEKPGTKKFATDGSFIIVAGGCDAFHDAAMRAYAGVLEEAFATFHGTIICGGTTQGISGVVGELASKSERRIQAVGYLPPALQTDGSATPDPIRYELRRTDRGDGTFTALEPIQSWLDLIETGIRPDKVRLLGINGGNIAGLEYRLAVALGATVGVVQGSGREADAVALDWPSIHRVESTGRLIVLPNDAMTIRAFIGLGAADADALPKDQAWRAARLTHQIFLEEQRYQHPNPVMQPWAKLRRDLQESNLNQVTYLVAILRSKGFGVRLIDPKAEMTNDPHFTDEEILAMGQQEHGRWNMERLISGWKYAKQKDPDKKLHHCLVPWEALDAKTQGYDLQNVRAWPQVLAEVGYEIYRLEPPAKS